MCCLSSNAGGHDGSTFIDNYLFLINKYMSDCFIINLSTHWVHYKPACVL